MAFAEHFVGGRLELRGSKVIIHDRRGSALIDEIHVRESVSSAMWDGGDVIVLTASGKRLRYSNNITSQYA